MPALPIPQPVITIPVFNQDRGPFLFDTTTKSSNQKPAVYCSEDACGAVAYKKGGVALQINQLLAENGTSPGCLIVSAASGSVSVTVPKNASAADIALFINKMRDDLVAGMIAVTCP